MCWNKETISPPKEFQGIQDYQEVWHEEMVALAMAFWRCAIYSGTPPGILCGVAQGLHCCLTPLLEHGDLENLDMLDVVMKDPMTLAPKESMSSPGGSVHVPAPSELTTSEPEETTQPKELTLVPRKRPLVPPGFTLSWADKSGSPPSEQTDWPSIIPLAAQLDFASLDSLQVIISHYPATGKMQCEYQSQTVALTSLTQTSLSLTLPKPLDQPNSSPWIEDL